MRASDQLKQTCGATAKIDIVARGEFFRHRDRNSIEVGRQLVRSFGKSVARAARPQAHEGQDPIDVDGSQGIGDDHRGFADRGGNARLPHQPGLYLAAMDASDRSIDARWLRDLDVHRHLRDEENDQLRFLTVQHD